MSTKNFLRKDCLVLAIVLFVYTVASPQLVGALSAKQKKLFQSNILYFNADACAGGACGCGVSPLTLTGSDNQAKVFNFFVSTMGYTPEQAAGATGSLMFESGNLDTKATNPTSGAFGIAQWLGSRLTDLKAFAGVRYDTLEKQLEFMKKELEGTHKSSNEMMLKAQSHTEAQEIWTKYFEGLLNNPDQWHFEDRNKFARDTLLKTGSGGSDNTSSSDSVACDDSSGSGELVGEFSLPVPKKWYDSNREWFTKKHHDYPAADIPVPSGTKIYAVADGKVSSASQTDSDGRGVHVEVTSGSVVYKYFHGTPGSVKVRVGDEVKAGQTLMVSDNTGNSDGPHLHFQITVSGASRCPQEFLDAIGKGQPPPKPESLAASGCSY